MMYWMVPKNRPRIIEFRKWTAHRLVSLARKIYPNSEAAYAFTASLVIDGMICGKSIVRVDPSTVFEEPTQP